MITSPQNAKLKLVRALLGRSKERREEGAFIAEGVRLVEEAVNSGWPIRFVLYSAELSDRGHEMVKRIDPGKVDVEEVASDLLRALSATETSQGVIAVLNDRQLPIPDTTSFILIPDQIRDPGNLGTLIRSAAAAGVDAILLPPETTDAFAPKVLRAGMGAHFRLPIHAMSWEEIKQVGRSKFLKFFLADMDGKSCWETDLRKPLALIVGGEAEGASEAARKLAQKTICIPMMGRIESLNAGVAGSVLMFEVVRQRK